MNNDVVIVLGMHRSGTSCLTGLLQQAGLELGDVVREAPHNKKGNRESLVIRALNDDVLFHNNGSWNSPPHRLAWNEKHRRERDEIIQRYSDKFVWGFKDPRLIFTLPFWQEGLKLAKVHYIGTFRHPLAVAKSLSARESDISIGQGVELWRHYNERLLEHHRQFEFPTVDFDLEQEPYLRSAVAAMKNLGILQLSDGSGLDFFEDRLRHQNELDSSELKEFAQVLEPVMPLYEKLKSFS